jgi:hypothetical protein
MLQKSVHNFMFLFLIVAVSHSGHHDSLVRGIVICYTKSVGTPPGGHGGGVVCTPVQRGRARCCGDSSKFFVGSWPCACMHSPPPIPLQPCTSSAPGPKSVGWKGIASELRSSMGCSHFNVFVSSASPKNLAAPSCLWTSAFRCIRCFQRILQIRYRCAA